MKKLLLPIALLFFCFKLTAQPSHTLDFETATTGSGWDWTVFEFAPSLTEVANPVSGGLNTSATVMEFIAYSTDQAYTGCWTEDDGTFTFDASNSMVSIMVYKPVISDIHFKVEGGTGTATELVVTNTVINQWEELFFDFSAVEGQTFNRIVIFPDFADRTEDHTIYFDNIVVPDGVVTIVPEPTTVPPAPTHAEEDVLAIYTEDYTNLPGTNFNPYWGQATTVTVNYIAAGNNTLKYENLNYQGTEYTNQDVSLFEYFHLDFWTNNSTNLSFYLISATPTAEKAYTLSITPDTWVSVDIPLEFFEPEVDLTDAFQFKVVGNGTVFFDNWYFWKNPSVSISDATLSDLQVDGTTVSGFSPNILNYNVELPAGTTVVPTVSATTTNPNANYVINDATSLPGTTSVVVTAEDGITQLTYNVNFTVASPEPSVAAPTPTQAPDNVISVYSDAYDNLAGTNFNPAWGQSTIVTVDYLVAGNNTLKYENLNYQGTEYSNQDVSGYDYLHVDFWTSNSTDLGIYLISTGPQETEYVFSITPESWVSVDIPLTDFVPPVDLTDVFQFKVEGNGTVWFDNLYFWKFAGTGGITFNPSNGATNVSVAANQSISFPAPVVLANGSTITNASIPSIITLKETDAGGTSIPFTGSISAAKDVISINPSANLNYDQVYYLAINNNVIKYQGGNLIPLTSITFTTQSPPAVLVSYDNFDNPSGLTWGFWDNLGGGSLDTQAANPALFSPVNTTPVVAKLEKTAASDPYTHSFAILGDKLDLSTDNQFQMMVYSETAGTVFALKLQNNDLLEPWTTEVTVEYTVQTANAWEIADFDFSAFSGRTDLDKILIMINGGQTGAGIHYFDEILGPPFTLPAASPVVVDAYTNNDGSAIEVAFNKAMEPEPGNEGNFNVYVNDVLNLVTSTYRKTGSEEIVVLNLSAPIVIEDMVTFSYLQSGTVTSLDGGILQPFTDYPVTVNVGFRVNLSALLEGPYSSTGMNADLNPDKIPITQPYNITPWNYTGSENVAAITNTKIVDWVLIECRDASTAADATPATMISRQAAFILKSGDIIAIDGSSELTFGESITNGLFIVVYHRNHLAVKSATALLQTSNIYTYDFTTAQSQAYQNRQTEVSSGVWALYAGNGNADEQLDALDKTAWEMDAGATGYHMGDFNLDGQVNNKDKNEVWAPNNGILGDGYTLIWEDNFNTDGAPDPAKWSYDIGTGTNGWGNGELQYYTDFPGNIKVENGVLKITAKLENYNGSDYTSARIKTEGKFSFQYGRIDFRTKLPGGEGIWPANWMLGDNFGTIGWPDCGEIDVMEYRGASPDLIHAAIHTPSSYGGTVNQGNTLISNAETEFHTYSVIWDNVKIRFLVDDIEYYVYEPSEYNASTWPFDASLFMLMNVAVGGSFGGTVNNAIFPQTMEVDYVKVYQKIN